MKDKLKAQIKAIPKSMQSKIKVILIHPDMKENMNLGDTYKTLEVIARDYAPKNIYYLCDKKMVEDCDKADKRKMKVV